MTPEELEVRATVDRMTVQALDEAFSAHARKTGQMPARIYLGSKEWSALVRFIADQLTFQGYRLFRGDRIEYREAKVFRVDAETHYDFS